MYAIRSYYVNATSWVISCFRVGLSLLRHVGGEQGIEVDRRQVQLREGAAADQAGDGFAGIGEQNGRAIGAQAVSQLP